MNEKIDAVTRTGLGAHTLKCRESSPKIDILPMKSIGKVHPRISKLRNLPIFIPFTRLRADTYESVRRYSPILVPLLDDYAYSRYFIKRWKEKKTFLNVEHDMVVTPGAIEALRDCRAPWCSIYYGPPGVKEIRGFMGCMKFSREFIAAHPRIWFKMKWGELDRILPRAATCALHVHADLVAHNRRET